MGPVSFDPEKATEAILYVSSRVGDMYATLELLYLADKLHLYRYGRFLFGDGHYALPHGPAPQGAYDLLRFVRGASQNESQYEYEPALKAFAIEGNTIRALRDVDASLFSESDEECLNEVISEFGSAGFARPKAATHDDASTSHCGLITPAAMAWGVGDARAALIEGSLRTRKWQDKEGRDRYTTEIVARTMQMLGGRGNGNSNGANANNQGARPHQPPRQSRPVPPQPVEELGGGDGFDDDIPF
jgi:uncharacterized phage-associated protein